MNKIFSLLLTLTICIGGITSCLNSPTQQTGHKISKIDSQARLLDLEEVEQNIDTITQIIDNQAIDFNGEFTSKDDVALYIHVYNKLPKNFVTKQQAEQAGWDPSTGNLQVILPGKSIGGNRFGNYEKNLPEITGRKYYECDIDYAGGRRNAKRIVYSNQGQIYYTSDHYSTFTQLY